MLHIERIHNALQFIDKHIFDKFTLEDISKSSFCSLSYMHRIFYQMTGYTVKEYIRLRRLAIAVELLQNTHKTVLEIAMMLDYKTYEGFSRAFKKEYMISPGEYKKFPVALSTCQPLDILNKYKFQAPIDLDFELTLSSEYVPSIDIVGWKISTSLDGNQHQNDICNFANDCLQNKDFDNIFDLNNTRIYGVYTNMTSQNSFNYTIGGLVKACNNINKDMITHVLPASNYAKFSLNRNDRIKEAWHYIYGIWFPKIKLLRSFGYDFEIYLENKVEIYIPMQNVPFSKNSKK